MQRIALIGYGFIGKMHFEAYKQIGNCKVTHIHKRTKTEIPLDEEVTFEESFDDILKNNDIDVVDICLPTFLHEEYIIKAIKAGKDIICEKPLTLEMKSARRIKDMLGQYHSRLLVGHVLRFWPEYKLFKKYLEDGKIKNIKTVHAKRLGQEPKWETWFQYPDKGGSALFDLHIHEIDFLYYLFGEVESVYARGVENEYGAWSHVMTTLTFTNGVVAYAEASHKMPEDYPFTMGLRVQADHDTLDFEMRTGDNIDANGHNDYRFIYYHDGEREEIKPQDQDPFQNELAYFVNCIENGESNSVMPFEDTLYTLKVIKGIQESLLENKLVYV